MATYIQGQTDSFDEVAFKPDYSFLTKALGARSQRYNEGLQRVRGIHNSLLSKPVSSQDNLEYRKAWLQKAQNTLNSVSKSDLSDPGNVKAAENVYMPLAEDAELARDMVETAKFRSAVDKLHSWRDSSDPKIRAQYNARYEQHANLFAEKMTNARRGDGSIFSVPSAEAVPYEDPIAYLNAQRKENILEIKRSKSTGMYIVTSTNGPGSERAFGDWAFQTLGSRFDRQFAIEAELDKEDLVKELRANAPGISEEEAYGMVRQKHISEALGGVQENIKEADGYISQLTTQIDKLERAHPGGIDASKDPNDAALHKTFLQQRDKLSEARTGFQSQAKELETNPQISSGMYMNSLASEKKRRMTQGWANTYTAATQQEEVRPDEWKISQWKQGQENQQNALDRSLKFQQMQNENARWGFEMQFKMSSHAEEMEMKGLALKAKGDLPTTETVGTWTPASEMTSVDVLGRIQERSVGNMVNHAFGAGGYVDYILNTGEEQRWSTSIRSAADKLYKKISDPAVQLAPDEVQSLRYLAQKAGLPTFAQPRNSAEAQRTLTSILEASYRTAGAQMNLDYSSKKSVMSQSAAASMSKTMAETGTMLREYKQQDQTFQRAAYGLFVDRATGKVKGDFSDAVKVIGTNSDGTPALSVAPGNKTVRRILSDALPRQFGDVRTTGSVQRITKLSGQELFTIFNAGTNNRVPGTEVKGLTPDLLQRGTGDLQKMFGDEAMVFYDPERKQATIKLNKDMGGKSPDDDNSPETVEITVPYSALQNIPRFTEKPLMKTQAGVVRGMSLLQAQDYLMDDLGPLSQLATNPTATVKAPSYMAANDFDYVLRSMPDTDGQPGYQITYQFKGRDGKVQTVQRPHEKLNMGDRVGSLYSLKQEIENLYELYHTGRAAFQNK